MGDDVERVARALAEEMDLDADDYYARKLARTALSAMPDAALLREALEALDEMVEWFSPPTDRGLHEGEREALKQARAAADKIRAALEHQQKGEEL